MPFPCYNIKHPDFVKLAKAIAKADGTTPNEKDPDGINRAKLAWLRENEGQDDSAKTKVPKIETAFGLIGMKPPAKRKFTVRDDTPAMRAFKDHPQIKKILENGRLESWSAYKKRNGLPENAPRPDMYAGVGNLGKGFHASAIFGGEQTPDKAATRIGLDNPDQLWDTIREAMNFGENARKSDIEDRKAENPDEEAIANEEARQSSSSAKAKDQKEEFDAANVDQEGHAPIPVEFLEPGSTVTVDGEDMKVMEVHKHPITRDVESVTLEDGKRFGRQVVHAGDEVYAEYTEQDDFADTPQKPETPKPTPNEQEKQQEIQPEAEPVRKSDAPERDADAAPKGQRKVLNPKEAGGDNPPAPELFSPDEFRKEIKDAKPDSELAKVKIGGKNALGAYRALTAKRDAGNELSPEEHQTLLDAEQALGQKMAFDMEAGKLGGKMKEAAPLPESGKKPPVRGPKEVQQSLEMGGEDQLWSFDPDPKKGVLNLLKESPMELPPISDGEAGLHEAVKAHIAKFAPNWDGKVEGPKGDEPDTFIGQYVPGKRIIRINFPRLRYYREVLGVSDAQISDVIQTTVSHEFIHAAEDDVLRDMYRKAKPNGGSESDFHEWSDALRKDMWEALKKDANVRPAAASYIAKMPPAMRRDIMADRHRIMPEITRMFVEQQTLGRTSEEAGAARGDKTPAWATFISKTIDKIKEWLGKTPPKELAALIEATKAKLKTYGVGEPEPAKREVDSGDGGEPIYAFGKTPTATGGETPPKPIGQRFKDALKTVSDIMTGTTKSKAIRDLGDMNATKEAVQHVGVRSYVPILTKQLLQTVMGDRYKDADFVKKVGETMRDDNILGGYDGLRDRLFDLASKNKLTDDEERELKDLSARVWQIEDVQDLDELENRVQANMRDQDVVDAIHRYEEHVVPLMEEQFNTIKGADPNTPRDTRGRHFEARVNLLSLDAEEKLADFADLDKPMPELRASSYRNPDAKRDKFDRRAAYTGEYSGSLENMMLNSFGSRMNETTKLDFYKALVKGGKAKILEDGESKPDQIGGEDSAILMMKMPKTNGVDGKTTHVMKRMAVPASKVDVIRRVLNTDLSTKQNPVFRALTKVQILGIADAMAHTKNQVSVITSSLGRDKNWQTVVSRIPILGQIQAISEIRSVANEIAAGSPNIVAEQAELAKYGMLRAGPKAEGWKKYLPGTFLHDNDTAARVILARRYKTLVDSGIATGGIEGERAFVMQIGEYNRRLMGQLESSLRDYGASPFIVAGQTFNRFGSRILTGQPGFQSPDAKAAALARAQMMTPLLTAMTTTVLANMFLSGNAFGRKGTPVGTIDLGPQHDDEKGVRKMIDLFQLSGIRRGLKRTGLDAMMNMPNNGDSVNEVFGKAISDSVTTNLHPYTGPAAGFLFETLTGKRLDLRQGWQRSFEARNYDGGKQYVENARSALKHLNTLGYALSEPVIGLGLKTAGMTMPPKDKSYGNGVGEAIVKSPLSAVGYKEGVSPATQLALKFAGDKMAVAPMDEQESERRAELSGIREKLSKGEKVNFGEEIKAGHIKPRDVSTLMKGAHKPRLVYLVEHSMSLDKAEQVYRKATPEEKQQLHTVMIIKRAKAGKSAADDDE